jgi:hypothetical protein
MHFIFVTDPDSHDAMLHFYYYLSQPEIVQFEILSINGRCMAKLVQGMQSRGDHIVYWSANNLEDGIYLVRFRAGEEYIIQNISVIRQENIVQ